MASHLKSLAKRARLNKGHVKAARAYKARVASFTSERAELRARMHNMTEEAVKLKSDLRHPSMARVRAKPFPLQSPWKSLRSHRLSQSRC